MGQEGNEEMGETKETAMSATQRRGTPRGLLSSFPWRKRWRSSALFLSSRDQRRAKDGYGSWGGEQEGGRRVEGNKRNSHADNVRDKDAAQSCVSFSLKKEIKE